MMRAVSTINASATDTLNALAALVPGGIRDAAANLLTEDDAKTLKVLIEEGMGANTFRALQSDLAYLSEWAMAATGNALPWPASTDLVLKFLAHHLWSTEEYAQDPSHGMPAPVKAILKGKGCLAAAGPHAPATVRRRLALWSTLHQWRGLIGPFADPHVKLALKRTTKASKHQPARKSRTAITKDVLEHLLQTCWMHRLVDIRDRALLLVAFASGGRRRSEVAELTLSQIEKREGPLREAGNAAAGRLLCYEISLLRTKTTNADDNEKVVVVGRAAEALREWISAASVKEGAIFRAVDRWENISDNALTPEAVNYIVKARCRMAGLDPKLYSAHGLRSGFMTQAERNGISVMEAMDQSKHRSVQQAMRYYDESRRAESRAARLAE